MRLAVEQNRTRGPIGRLPKARRPQLQIITNAFAENPDFLGTGWTRFASQAAENPGPWRALPEVLREQSAFLCILAGAGKKAICLFISSFKSLSFFKVLIFKIRVTEQRLPLV